MRVLLLLGVLAGCRQLVGIEDREPFDAQPVDAAPTLRLELTGDLPLHGEVSANMTMPPISVRVLDPDNNLVAGTATIKLSLVSDDPSEKLLGTIARDPVDGVAVFDDLAIDRPTSRVRITAASTDTGPVTSPAFSITNASVLTRFRGGVTFDLPAIAHHAIGVDVDADGDRDVLATQPGSFVVIENQGEGVFDDPVSVALVGQMPEAIAAGDLDGDGKIDVVTASPSGDTVAIALGDGAGGFVAQKSIAVCDAPQAVTIADVTSDGRADIVVMCLDAADGRLLRNLSAGSLDLATPTNIALGMSSCTGGTITTADVNRDGRTDVVAAACGSLAVALQHDTVPNTFRAPQVTSLAAANRRIGLTDLDGDGDGDFIGGGGLGAPAGDPNSVGYRLNATAINATTVTFGNEVDLTTGIAGATGAHLVSAIDLDKDARPDIVSVFLTTHDLYVFPNQGGSPVGFGARGVVTLDFTPIGLDTAQLDGAAGDDLIVTYSTPRLALLFTQL